MATSVSRPPIERWHQLAWLTLMTLLLVTWLTVGDAAPGGFAWTLAALVIVFGLPHGACDPLVARALGQWRTPPQLLAHLLMYVGLAAGVLWLWWAWPLASLSGFLMLSAWHFGHDWPTRPDGRAVKGWERLLAGVAVIGAPVLFHGDRVAELFALLVGTPGTGAGIDGLVRICSWLAIPALLYLVAAATTHLRHDPLRSLEWFALIVAAWCLPPLVYFAAYFCFLHSPRHLIGLASDPGIGMSRTTAMVMLALTGLTVLAMGLAFALLGETRPPESRVVQVTFVGLAALTVPHMLLVERYVHGREAG